MRNFKSKVKLSLSDALSVTNFIYNWEGQFVFEYHSEATASLKALRCQARLGNGQNMSF